MRNNAHTQRHTSSCPSAQLPVDKYSFTYWNILAIFFLSSPLADVSPRARNVLFSGRNDRPHLISPRRRVHRQRGLVDPPSPMAGRCSFSLSLPLCTVERKTCPTRVSRCSRHRSQILPEYSSPIRSTNQEFPNRAARLIESTIPARPERGNRTQVPRGGAREREKDGRAGVPCERASERWLEAILIAQGRRSQERRNRFLLRDLTARFIASAFNVKLN